jgi:hypothetical protein
MTGDIYDEAAQLRAQQFDPDEIVNGEIIG